MTRWRSAACTVKIMPDYSRSTNLNEMEKRIKAFIEVPLSCFNGAGEYAIKISYDENLIGQMLYQIAGNGLPYSNFMPKQFMYMYLYRYINIFAFITFAILISVSYFLEIRFCKEDTHKAVFSLMGIRYVVFSSIYLLAVTQPFSIIIIALTIIPWGLSSSVRCNALKIMNFLIGFLSKERIQRISENGEHPHKDLPLVQRDRSLLWTVLSIVILLVFIYTIFSESSFLWGMFEERDFLRSLDVGNFKYFPTLGPELLFGGQTPGGFLYIFLAPFAKLGGSPVVLAILNKIFFILSAMLIWLILNKYVNGISALLGILLFCSSAVVAIFAYWPVHPSMSLVFYFLFIFLVLRGFVDGSKIAVILSGLVLSILVQFHFSYYLVLVAYIAVFFSLKKIISINKRTFLLSVLLFLIPFMPYIITEILQGFPNTRLILERNRAHPDYAPTWQSVRFMFQLISDWIVDYSNHRYLKIIRLSLLFISLLIFYSAFTRIWHLDIDKKELLYLKIITILFVFPMLIFFLMGMGYVYRHVISFAPAIYIITASGAGLIIKRIKGFFALIIPVLCGMLLILWIISAKNAYSTAVALSEWAVDYKIREDILNFISAAGISKKEYSSKIYWWWLNWSEDPALYEWRQNKSDRVTQVSKVAAELQKPGMYLLVVRDIRHLLSGFPILFNHTFNLPPIGEANEKYLFLPTRLKKFKGAYPSGNSISRMRLEPIEQAVEFLNLKEDGLFNVDFKNKADNRDGKFYIFSVQKGRIKVLTNLKEEHSNDRTVIHWEMVSASLNGYYQEIKTIWKPYITLTDPASGERFFAYMVDDVVGSLIYKTPLNGTIEIPKGKRNWQISIGAKGWFDQSVMSEPMLKDVRWNIHNTKKLRLNKNAPV
ncbi:MAG: hypothetical protein HY754_00320 [Nitrospirae bacterium]|nr:hypothetical protein [Nitrospirota bacterium]